MSETSTRRVPAEVARLRGKLGAAVRRNDPAGETATRRDLKAAVLENSITSALTTVPVLDAGQRFHLAGLLVGTHAEQRQGVSLRDYFLRVSVYPEVINQGEPCVHCQLIGNAVEVNIHATDMDGRPLYDESCSGCVLSVLDHVMDVDPSHVVVLEVTELCAP